MPDIDNRSDLESKLATILRRSFGRTREQIIAALGTPPDVANIPDSLWDKLRQDVDDDTRRAIAILLLLGIRRMNDLHGDIFTMPPQQAGEIARDIAAERSSTLADSVVSTFQDRLQTAVETKSPGDLFTESDARKAMKDIAAGQADAGGITETTAANTAGEDIYRTEFEKSTGLKLASIWVTSRDAAVCRICQPLDRQPEEVYGEQFPSGPPAHPRCRCFLVYQPVEEKSEV